ncbi:uncharacterized protein LOC132712946 [Ruditapes philippinarum]|uniref:uncharacterized protein LOC132712946 n=1 Tax=Ruditapes philippinarum TaxID=129788 RepID=UPI00295BF967|nr:uncharacterized protein LOC132712946 [Ruditapes philippinarum]
MACIIRYITIASIFIHISVEEKDGTFNGGSISYKLEEIAGRKIAHVELITGWTLGKGPCGDACKSTSVNLITNDQRDTKEKAADSIYCFGNFSSDYKEPDGQTSERHLNHIVHQNYTEIVIAVSENAMWEQELMTFSILMEHEEEDIMFKGSYWRPLMYGSDLQWQIQSKVVSKSRSDTKGLNNCPQVVTKPFYRVKLDQSTTIRIPMIDPDNDIVRCDLSQFAEVGTLPVPEGLHVHKEFQSSVCKVTINTSKSLNYSDNTWVVIPITFRDYNKMKIVFGDKENPPVKYSLSSTGAQFAVQVLEHLETPEFVSPTIKGDHMFIVYVGTIWNTDVYARASENTTIERFIQSGRNREKVTLSSLRNDTRERVVYTSMSWEPTVEDKGQHVLCIRVVDITG